MAKHTFRSACLCGSSVCVTHPCRIFATTYNEEYFFGLLKVLVGGTWPW